MNIQIPYFPCAMATLNLIEAVEKLILTWSHGYVCHSFAVVLCGWMLQSWPSAQLVMQHWMILIEKQF